MENYGWPAEIQKPKLLKESTKLNWNSGGVGQTKRGTNQKTIHEGGMDVFWNNMLRLDATDKFCTC